MTNQSSFSRIVVLCVTLVLSGLWTSIHAQDFDRYRSLEHQGQLPPDFTTPSSAKYKLELENLKKVKKVKQKKNQKQFYLESYFTIDDLLQSGKVLLNPKLNDYLGRIADKLLEGDDFRSKVRFYVIKSPAVNAFATSQGSIFICMGLLAQLENEAQLAYIMSHEIQHVKKEHSLELFLDSKGISRSSSNREIFKSTEFNDKLLRRSVYSKELEREADSLGLAIYLKANYSVATLDRVFDVLQYSYLPWDSEPFKKDFMEDQYFKFPKSYTLDSIAEVEVDEEDEEKYGTHPSVASRRKSMSAATNNVSEANRVTARISQSEFEQIQKMARFELPMLMLHNHDYPSAIYNSYLALKENPGNAYLEKCLAKALFMLSKYSNSDDEDIENESCRYTKVQGEEQQLYYLLYNMKNVERNALAAKYLYDQAKKHPQDKELKSMLDDALYDLYSYHEFDKKGFSKEGPSAKAAEALNKAKNDTLSNEANKPVANAKPNKKNKYDKLKEKKAKREEKTLVADEDFYWKYAFVSAYKDTGFVAALKKASDRSAESTKNREYRESSKGRSEYRSYMKRVEKKGYKLGIDKIMVINPYYLSIDGRRGNEVEYIRSEAGQENMVKVMRKNMEASGLKGEVLSVPELTADDIKKFNDISLLNEWFAEQSDFGSMNPIGFKQEEVDSIAKKYGTEYFLWSGVVTMRKSVKVRNLGLALATMLILPAPLTIPAMFVPEYETLYFSILYDVKNRRNQVINFEVSGLNDTNGFLNSKIYDTFNQIKRK